MHDGLEAIVRLQESEFANERFCHNGSGTLGATVKRLGALSKILWADSKQLDII